MQDSAIRSLTTEVSCPHCGEPTSLPVPDETVDLHVRRSVAAFGEHDTVACSNAHTFWVYVC